MSSRLLAIAAAVALIEGLPAALWLLLFAGPALLNLHRDDALAAAVLIDAGVPIGIGWGVARLRRSLAPPSHDDL